MYDTMRPDAARGEFEGSEDMLRRYSAGELDRRSVMDTLDIGYGELLERLHQLGLRMPTVPADRMAEMAAVIERLPTRTE